MNPVFDLERVVRTLARHEVDFIVVGGIAARLQGAPVMTEDVDIVYRIEETNIFRLKDALAELGAVARGDRRNIPFNETHLRTTGHKLAMTRAGALDVLGTVNDGLRYEDLIDTVDVLEVSGCDVRVLKLERLLALKKQLGRAKDLVMVPIIEATLRERDRRDRNE
jgi:predicted nucleotidyltransferase